MGVSGSGKTTIGSLLAEHLNIPFLEGDSLHPERNIALMKAGTPLTDEDRQEWLTTIGEALAHAARTHASLVVSCSALKRSYRDMLRAACPSVRFVFLDGSRDVIETRLRTRSGHFMPISLLDSQLKTLEVPAQDENVYTVDIALPPRNIVTAIDSILRL
jgi:carbohydrate kinase (thermoresistant glucokinase family)